MKCKLCRDKGFYRSALDMDIWCGCPAGVSKEIDQIEWLLSKATSQVASLESEICRLRTRLVEKKNVT